MVSPNRATEGVGSEVTSSRPKARKPRTEAQQKAARQNGARSRGPKTAAGKTVSSLNALKHGLLSRAISMVSSAEDRRMLRKLRKRLVEDLRPVGIVQEQMVERMAADYLLETKIRQTMAGDPESPVNSAVLPPNLDPVDRHAPAMLRCLNRLIACCDRGEPLACPPRANSPGGRQVGPMGIAHARGIGGIAGSSG